MADFPAAIYTPTTKANRPGVVYDAAKTKIIYAEDFNLDRDEIVAIENTLGLNPEGDHTTVRARVDHIDANLASKYWIRPFYWALTGSNQTNNVAGRVMLSEFEVYSGSTVDGVVILNSTTVDGNVTVGIYGPVTTRETVDGLPLVVSSASVALVGVSVPQFIPFDVTLLEKGMYYVAVEFSSISHIFVRNPSITHVLGFTRMYTRDGGYGALTNPCPASVDYNSQIPISILRGTF